MWGSWPGEVSAASVVGNWQEQFEFRRKLVLGVQSVGEVDSSDSAVGVDLHSQGLNVIGSIGSPSEITKIELNLVPALVQSHGHGADKRFDSGGGLVVGGSEPSSHILVIEHLDFEGEVFL